MAPKMSKKKGSKSKSQSTGAKVANKKLNKFAKQGKLRQQRLKQKKKEQKQKRHESKQMTNNENEDRHDGSDSHEDEDSLQEEDIQFYTEQNSLVNTDDVSVPTNTFMASVMASESKTRKRKNREETEEDESSKYEKMARTQFTGETGTPNVKMLLPIKDKGRVIPKMMEVEESDDAAEEEEESAEEENCDATGNNGSALPNGETVKEERLPVLSSSELIVARKKKLAERKQKIAELATAVIESPEENVAKLKELRKLLGEKDPGICLTVRKLVMVSLCEVFKDVIPGYRLRLPTAQEKEQRMKQETKKLLDYEAALLLSYKTYLEYLEHIIKGKSFENSPRLKRLGFCDVELPRQSVVDLMTVALQCMCKLLTAHPHFNYRSDIITFLVPFMSHKNDQLSETVCQTVKNVFVADKSGEVTLEIVRAIFKLVKSRKFNVQPKVLEVLLCLKIKEINMEKQHGSNKMKRKEKFKTLSRRERKRLKESEELEKQLQETKATQDKEKRLKVHTQIVETMFTMFFNVLKREERCPLLPVVLEGLAKFTHLISVDFFHDLYAVFNKLIESGELAQVEILHCVQTAFHILSGQGAVLTIDPMKFYKHLYNAILNIHAGLCPENAAIAIDTVDAALIGRRRQVTQQRVLAFFKRLTTMGLHQLPEAAAGMVALARCLVSLFPYTDYLFDQEVEGSGVYMPHLQEPEHCHASNAVLWELHALKKHYHPEVKRLANALLHKSSSSHGELSQKTPVGVYSHIKDQDIFPASLPAKSGKKTNVAASGFRSEKFEEDLRTSYSDLFE